MKTCSLSKMAWMPMMWWSMKSMKASSNCRPGQQKRSTEPDVVEAAAGAAFLSTLVDAVKKAGLVETLKGDGPFTVFAPSDEAFAKMERSQLESLLEDPKKLAGVLTYHVVSGRFDSASLQSIDSLKTLQGTSVQVDTSDGVRIGGSKVLKANLRVRNGIIHLIDSVLVPKSK